MSNTIQGDFIASLLALAPKGVTARTKAQYANTGAIYYQDADFQTILGVSYDFQDSYAGFNLTQITDAEKAVIGARNTGSKPGGNDFTWDGWGRVEYAKGELKQVRDGVAWLLATRTGQSVTDQDVVLSPGTRVYIAGWSGGYQRPDIFVTVNKDDAQAKYAEWTNDADDVSDWISLVEFNPTTGQTTSLADWNAQDQPTEGS